MSARIESLGLRQHQRWSVLSYGVDLAALRQQKKGYLSRCSRNTRYQIRRSERYYQALGAVSLRKAETADEALAFFEETEPLHLSRWPDSSGFSNSDFCNFHRHLIETHWQTGCVHFWKLSCAQKTCALIYSFYYQNRVYFYFSGVLNESVSVARPGLLCHSLCLQHYLEVGAEYYDFMGGEERYKASLADCSENIMGISLQKNCWPVLVEHGARKVKRFIQGL